MNELFQQLDFDEKKKKEKKYMMGAEPFFDFRNPEVGILLLHGFTATPYHFFDLRAMLLEKNLTLYAPAIAGHATHPEDLRSVSIQDWIESIEKAYNELKTKVKKIVVIGNSFGANLAFQLAMKNNEQLKGIISLGAPVFLRWHRFLLFRVYTYGWFKRFYKKRRRNYASNLMDVSIEISYPVIPMRSLRLFFRFLRYFTLPALKYVTAPVLLVQAHRDPIVHPKSIQYLHQYLMSEYKKVCWLNDKFHSLPDAHKKEELFDIIYEFIQEVTQENHSSSSRKEAGGTL